MTPIQEAIQKLVNDEPVESGLARTVAGGILAGETTPAQIGAFLVALRIRGEQPEHLTAFAGVMREHAEPVQVEDAAGVVDTCGTGGDHSGTFNISTAAAIVAAGAGVRIAKHGNRAITGRCGSADVLAALGVRIELTPEQAADCLRKAGIAFFYAPVFHGAMRHAGPARREIGVRTIFNMLGPLANPAGAGRQLIGVYDRRLTEVFAAVLQQLGSRHVLAVHGGDGLDEITLTGPTFASEARIETPGEIRTIVIEPEALGLCIANSEDLVGGNAEENAAIIREILDGAEGPRTDVVLLNAGAALYVGGRAEDLREGIALARKAIATGAARESLGRLVAASNEAAPV